MPDENNSYPNGQDGSLGSQPTQPQQPAPASPYQGQAQGQGVYQPASGQPQAGGYWQGTPGQTGPQAQVPPTSTWQPPQPGGSPAGGTPSPQPGRPSKPKKEKSGKAPAFVMGLVGAVLGLAIGGGVTYGVVSNAVDSGSSSQAATSQGSSSSSSSSSSNPVTIAASDTDTSLSEAVAAKVSPSIVSVYVYSSQQQSYGLFGGSEGSSSSDQLAATGSGVIISNDGYIITNQHVVAEGTRYTVVINNEEVDASLVGTDESSDLAVLKVDRSDLTAIEIGDSDSVQVGEWCMTMGSPYGLDQSASTGIVSAKYRSTAMESTSGVAIYANLIQTDAAINSGSSGGALVNEQGQLIGITTLTTSSGYSIGFAIPSNYAYDIAEQIINNGEAHHAYLGVSMTSMNSSIAQQLGVDTTSGAYINSVVPGLAAANAGLQKGDIITKVDDTDITTSSSLIMTIRSYNIGDTVTVTYLRDGQEQTAQVTLSSDEGQDTAGTSSQQQQQGPSLGFGFGNEGSEGLGN